jgi:hypothetical protein
MSYHREMCYQTRWKNVKTGSQRYRTKPEYTGLSTRQDQEDKQNRSLKLAQASNTYGVKHGSTARETSPRCHSLDTPRPACRTTSTVHLSHFTPLSVSSSPSPSTENMLQPLSHNLRKGVMWRNTHITVFPPSSHELPRSCWNFSGGCTSKTLQLVRTQHQTRPVLHQQVRLAQRANSFVFSAVTGTVRCKSTKWTINDVGEVLMGAADTSPT